MAISQAMWCHGHSIQPEDPGLTVGRIGWAGQIRHPGSQGWYHLAVPTPVIVTDIRLRIDAALIQFSSGSQGHIQTVDVYDGGNRIAHEDNVSLSGTDQLHKLAITGRPQIFWAVGISIFMTLGADPANAWIDIHAGGADFV